MDHTNFETGFIRKESVVVADHMVVDRARILLTEVKRKVVQDNTDYLQFGQNKDTEFWDFETVKSTISAYNNFESKYKIIGIQIQTSFAQMTYQRQTYDILNFLGDIGGLDSILTSIAILLMNHYSTLKMKSHLLTKLYKKSTEDYKNIRDE